MGEPSARAKKLSFKLVSHSVRNDAHRRLHHCLNYGAAEDGQATFGSDRLAYGCCDQALTRFAADPPAGPGRLLRLQRGE